MSDADAPKPLQMMVDFWGFTLVVMGRTSGALAALAAGPATAPELAARAGLDELNMQVWLRGMAAAGLVERDGASYRISDDTAAVLSPDFPIDFGAALDLAASLLSSKVDDAVAAMATGAGIKDAWSDLNPIVGRLNGPTWRMALVDDFIAADADLRARLDAGGAIADLACGNGDAARVMAAAFPACTVAGYDPNAPEVDDGRVHLVRRTTMPESTYDLITCLDSFHHLGDPRAAADSAYAALKPGGTFLVAEENRTGDPTIDDADPFSIVTHTAALLYCMQDNLANGGTGHTPSGGLGWAEEALSAAGFSTTSHESETGYRVFHARKA